MENFKLVLFLITMFIGYVIIGFTSLLPIILAVITGKLLWLLLYLGIGYIVFIEILVLSFLLALFD